MPPSRDPRPPRRAGAPKKAGGQPAKRSGKPGERPAKPGDRPQRSSKAGERSSKPYAKPGERTQRAGKPAGRPNRRTAAARSRQDAELEAPKTWGSLARKGTGRLRDSGPSKASEAWREAADDADRPRASDPWVRVDDVRSEATAAVGRGQTRSRTGPPRDAAEPVRRQRKTTPDVADELARVAGAGQAPKLGQRLAEATRAYERERYPEARSMLKTLADRAPGSAAVRELYGLTLYRLGQWKLAQRELEAFVTLTGSTEQHPVLADCARALGQRQRVNELWEELRAASPSAELVTEGRIVAAGSLADEGKLREGIELLEQGWKAPKKLKEHHLRLLYALGDLRERAGEIPAARAQFRRIYDVDPGFADVADRLRSL